jgi:hypothetical protein
MTNKANAKRPTNNTEAIEAQLNSPRDWDVLSGLLMRECGLAAMPARVKAAQILKGQGRLTAEDIAWGDAARTIARGNR